MPKTTIPARAKAAIINIAEGINVRTTYSPVCKASNLHSLTHSLTHLLTYPNNYHQLILKKFERWSLSTISSPISGEAIPSKIVKQKSLSLALDFNPEILKGLAIIENNSNYRRQRQ